VAQVQQKPNNAIFGKLLFTGAILRLGTNLITVCSCDGFLIFDIYSYVIGLAAKKIDKL